MENQLKDLNTTYIVYNRKEKSIIVSTILTFLFGGLGLFYATVQGALIMIFIYSPCIMAFFLTGNIFLGFLFLFFYYMICILWGIKSIRKINHKIINKEDANEKLDFSTYNVSQFILISILLFCFSYSLGDFFSKHF